MKIDIDAKRRSQGMHVPTLAQRNAFEAIPCIEVRPVGSEGRIAVTQYNETLARLKELTFAFPTFLADSDHPYVDRHGTMIVERAAWPKRVVLPRIVLRWWPWVTLSPEGTLCFGGATYQRTVEGGLVRKIHSGDARRTFGYRLHEDVLTVRGDGSSTHETRCRSSRRDVWTLETVGLDGIVVTETKTVAHDKQTADSHYHIVKTLPDGDQFVLLDQSSRRANAA